jgi:hypothetical protein
MGVTRIIIGFTITISITIRITTLKITITSGLSVGKRGRQTRGRTHKIHSHYSVMKTRGRVESFKAGMQILLSNDESPIYPELFD